MRPESPFCRFSTRRTCISNIVSPDASFLLKQLPGPHKSLPVTLLLLQAVYDLCHCSRHSSLAAASAQCLGIAGDVAHTAGVSAPDVVVVVLMRINMASIRAQAPHLVALALLHIPQADLMGPRCHVHQRRAQRGVLQAQPGRRAQRGRQRLYRVTLHSSTASSESPSILADLLDAPVVACKATVMHARVDKAGLQLHATADQA